MAERDPIGGLVQVPCIERNAMAAIKAINASRMALRGDGEHFVSLDKVIRTMRGTGRDMKDKDKETSSTPRSTCSSTFRSVEGSPVAQHLSDFESLASAIGLRGAQAMRRHVRTIRGHHHGGSHVRSFRYALETTG